MYTSFSRKKVEDISEILGGEYTFQFITNFWWNMYDSERTILDNKYLLVYKQIDELLASKLHSLCFSDTGLLQEIACCSRDYRATLFFYGIELVHIILFSSNALLENIFTNLLRMKTLGIPSTWCLFDKIGDTISLRYLLPENRWYNRVLNLEVIDR